MNRPLDFEPEQAEPARFSVEEFMRMADLGAFEDMKVELDHGEIIRVTPPYSDHAVLQGQVIGKLYAALSGLPLQVVGEVGVRLGSDTLRVFDAGVLEHGVHPGRLIDPAEVRLIVEVAVASLARDTGPKQRDYAAAGINSYWVIDVTGRTIQVHGDPAASGYRSVEKVAFGDPLIVPGTDASIVLD